MEIANPDNSFKKIFSNRETRNEMIARREGGTKDRFPPKMDNDEVEKKNRKYIWDE